MGEAPAPVVVVEIVVVVVVVAAAAAAAAVVVDTVAVVVVDTVAVVVVGSVFGTVVAVVLVVVAIPDGASAAVGSADESGFVLHTWELKVDDRWVVAETVVAVAVVDAGLVEVASHLRASSDCLCCDLGVPAVVEEEDGRDHLVPRHLSR